MQVGEPVAVVPVVAPPPDVEFAAELVAVTFKSPVKTSHAKTEIVGPHWEVGKESAIAEDWSARAKRMRLPVELYYSRRAAVFLVKKAGEAGEAREVEVKVKVTKSKNVSGDAQLGGRLRGLSIEGLCPTAAGEHTITARITEPPEAIQAYRGKIAWGLEIESAGISVDLGRTLAEIYFILGTPSEPYEEVGVWTEVLRFLCGRVGILGIADGKAAAAKVASYCHTEHSLRYDTRHGDHRYGVASRGGIFNLDSYLMRKEEECNCYDQAAAVQALSGAVGVPVQWLYLRPFGYIKPTLLVGVGLCNNPFFGKDEKKKLVAPDSPDREPFANHAFASVAGVGILDACAGPHLGTETIREYLDASLDRTPALYDGEFHAGTTSEVVLGRGVRAVT